MLTLFTLLDDHLCVGFKVQFVIHDSAQVFYTGVQLPLVPHELPSQSFSLHAWWKPRTSHLPESRERSAVMAANFTRWRLGWHMCTRLSKGERTKPQWELVHVCRGSESLLLTSTFCVLRVRKSFIRRISRCLAGPRSGPLGTRFSQWAPAGQRPVPEWYSHCTTAPGSQPQDTIIWVELCLFSPLPTGFPLGCTYSPKGCIPTSHPVIQRYPGAGMTMTMTLSKIKLSLKRNECFS